MRKEGIQSEMSSICDTLGDDVQRRMSKGSYPVNQRDNEADTGNETHPASTTQP